MEHKESTSEQKAPPAKDKQKLTKMVLFILVLLAVVAIGLLISNHNKNKAASHVQAAAIDTAEITISKDGFSPATIQIKKGQSVTWTNTDDATHQVAADPHPTHSSLSTLVSDPLSKNDTYTYPFEKAGTYTYHDEQNPLKFNGTIIVK
jgi:plastocyanin